ncbi:DUF3846 domain-containing protein [Cytobacillus firmus]|nr:DUF3846 domain-containing protein [Cytobacillus firmus]
MKTLKIVRLNVGSQIEVIEMVHSLEDMQAIVGGWLERVRITDDIDLWINEEGLLQELPLNFVTFVVKDGEPQPVHSIVGNVFFASHDEEGETISLNDIQIKRIKKMFSLQRDACIANIK